MADRITSRDVRRLAETCGVVVTTWSPGDGMTRYRLIRGDAEFPDYFGSSGSDVLGTTLGAHETYTWLQGFRAAQLLPARENGLDVENAR